MLSSRCEADRRASAEPRDAGSHPDPRRATGGGGAESGERDPGAGVFAPADLRVDRAIPGGGRRRPQGQGHRWATAEADRPPDAVAVHRHREQGSAAVQVRVRAVDARDDPGADPGPVQGPAERGVGGAAVDEAGAEPAEAAVSGLSAGSDRKSTRLNSSHSQNSYAVFCLKKKTKITNLQPRIR